MYVKFYICEHSFDGSTRKKNKAKGLPNQIKLNNKCKYFDRYFWDFSHQN